MSQTIILDSKFEKTGESALPESYNEINSHNLYLYSKAYLANLRASSADTKSRSQVKGGGKKPWAQKGGGRARAGSITSPIFVGGGVAFGPSSDKNYFQKVNKKQKKLALSYSLNEKAKAGSLYVVEDLKVESGKTKDAVALVKKVQKRDVLIVVDSLDEKTYLAYRNIPFCDVVFASELNAYLISVYHTVVIKKDVYAELVKEA